MYNFLKCCCVFFVSFLLFSNVFGYSRSENITGIYICTKDIDRPGSLVSERIIADFSSDGDENSFLPLEGVTESGERHQFGRHCFMLHAKNNGLVIEQDGTKRLRLTKLSSYGFGKANGRTAVYEERLVNLPKNVAVSCTMLVDENGLSEEKINQEISVIKGEMSDNYNENDLRLAATSALITKMWNAVTRKMDLEKVFAAYNLGGHNCCTVAYRAAAMLFDGDENKVREKVDPRSFNLYGMGVVWQNYLLKSSWALIESSSGYAEEHSDKAIELHNGQQPNRPLIGNDEPWHDDSL